MSRKFRMNQQIPTHQCRAIVFDMDGLLINTEPYWRKAEIEVFSTVGIELTEDDCRQTMGYRFQEVVDFWHTRKPWANKSKETVFNEVIESMEFYISTEAEMIAGADDAVRAAINHTSAVALASGSPMRLIQAVLRKLGMKDSIPCVLSAEFELWGKPHPAIFLRAAEKLSTSPQHCLVLEDSINGVIAAKAARMNCIAIPEHENKSNRRFAIADYCLNSLLEFPGLLPSQV
jgi:sugar-phosphatase